MSPSVVPNADFKELIEMLIRLDEFERDFASVADMREDRVPVRLPHEIEVKHTTGTTGRMGWMAHRKWK